MDHTNLIVFLATVLLLGVSLIFLGERKRERTGNIKLFRIYTIMGIAVLVIFPCMCFLFMNK